MHMYILFKNGFIGKILFEVTFPPYFSLNDIYCRRFTLVYVTKFSSGDGNTPVFVRTFSFVRTADHGKAETTRV